MILTPELPSEEEVRQFIKESNLIENISDPREIDQSLKAWDVLIRESKLTHELICMVQGIITYNQQDLRPEERGQYRNIESKNFVTVNDRAVPTGFMVEFLMDNWLLDYEDLDPREAHIRFEHIHPFVDGNGRTGRMLMNWQYIQMGKPICIIRNATKFEDYYPWFD